VARLRLPISLALAVALTGGLFWFLWALVGARLELAELQPAAKIDFTRLRRDSEIQDRRRDKPQRERPEQAPSAPRISRLSFERGTQKVEMIAPDVDAAGSLSRLSISVGGSDRDVIPLVRIEPEYPMRAAQRGIEGWVLVQFTISPAGTVKDATVIDSQPGETFDAAVLKAVSRWKYNPKVEGGVPVERRGIQVLLAFELDES
jgi:protein TonB